MTPRVTKAHLPTDPSSDIRHAVEITMGRAVVVIAEHMDGTIGIGHMVRRRTASPDTARERCLTYALHRISTLRDHNDKLAAEDYTLVQAAGGSPL